MEETQKELGAHDRTEIISPSDEVISDEVGTAPKDVSIPEEKNGTIFAQKTHQIFTSVVQHKNWTFVSMGVLLCALFVGAGYFYYTQQSQIPVKEFTNVYSFVPEKISKSALIPISLPEGVEELNAQQGISFNPVLKGVWVTENNPGVIVFDPEEPLKDGTYYAVNMDTGTVQMSGDFYVDQDPRIESIFPAEFSETNEDTKITIVFNRPMVPLTTLTAQELVDIPITISPKTEGHFKWISTRSLQFIPDTTLVPSSEYTVTIDNGFVSLDGLKVPEKTHTFSTRLLRYTIMPEGNVGYRSPMIIGFNQPVNLNEVEKRIHVAGAIEADVPVIVEYGTITRFDEQTQKEISYEDRSKIFVFSKKDSHGRKKVWDFNSTYTLTVTGAVPEFGTHTLEEERTFQVSIPNILEQVQAVSERTSLAMPELFDPEGTLVLNFYDAIDKDASDITIKGLKNIVYGERCKTDVLGEEILQGNSCEKEPDTHVLILSFDSSKITVGESLSLTLERIVTSDGFKINTETITVPVQVYTPLRILRTVPTQGDVSAPLDSMYICTNAPLGDPGDAGMHSYLKTDGYIVFGRWTESYYVDPNSYNPSYHKCKSGEFETPIQYGLLPETPYALSLTLTDVFGQHADGQLSFKTSPPKEQYTRFHNMQLQYNVTQPDRTKLTYAVENLEYVDMHICRMTPEAFLKRTDRGEERFAPPRGDDCAEVVNERISLPKKYWVNNYFQVDLKTYFVDTRGYYVLTFSNPLYRAVEDIYDANGRFTSVEKQLYDHTYVSVTNLSVGKKEIEYSDETALWSNSSSPVANELLNKAFSNSTNLYWVNYSSSLTPTTGATITQYVKSGQNSVLRSGSSGFTNGEGVAKVHSDQNIIGAVIQQGSDTAVVSDWADMLQYASPAYSASRTYVYTDRPIYRPGHTVYIRGIDRIGFDGSYEVWQQGKAPITVYDSMGAKVYDTTLTVSGYGTFNTQFELPKDAPLGSYRIEVFGQSAWFDVEEYVPSAFKVEVKSNKEEYINGDTVQLDVQADYYFGVPLSEGTVSYSVTAQDYYFDRYTDEYFNFGIDWYSCYSCGYGDSFLFRGETRIDAKGSAHIERAITLQDYFDRSEKVGSKLVTATLTAKDINGRAVSIQKTFIVHAGEFYIGATTDSYYAGKNAPVSLRVKTLDTNGKPLSFSNITRTINKIDWETFKRQEVDGGFYYRSEKRVVEISKDTIKTDREGSAEEVRTFAEEGQYEIILSKKDDRGNTVETTSSVYIYGENAVSVPPNNNYELDLEVQNPNVSVGDTASVLIKSPYDNAKVLITAERGAVYDYWVKDITGGLYLHEFPIKAGYAPDVFISALLFSKDPEVKYGTTQFSVGKDTYKLDVDVVSDKEEYLPGENVTLTITTKDNTGTPVPAEVSLAVADLSVLALKGNPKKDPLQFFYDGFPLYVSTASNIKNILHEIDIPLGTKGGGGNPDDPAAKKRGLFKDTAYWNATVETDSAGHAVVSFVLPDNLTTWQIESIGITKDTKVGVDYKGFTSKKKLMAVPLKPRFVVPGDTFNLGAQIFNETESDVDVQVKLASQSLTLKDSGELQVHVEKGETETVYFGVSAPEEIKSGEHIFTISASSGSFVDSVEQTIPVTPNTTYETVATANMSTDQKSAEYLYVPNEVVDGEGGLSINANATMAVFMLDALTYMATYPYGCSEQLASALSTIGTLTRALTVPNMVGEFNTIEYQGEKYSVDDVVKNGLEKVYQTQVFEGGFAYYSGLEPNRELTMHVLTALTNLKNAGFTIDADVLARAQGYIETETMRVYTEFPTGNEELIVWAEYVLRESNGHQTTMLTDTLTGLITNDAFIQENISSMSLAYLAIITAQGFSASDTSRVYTALTNRMGMDGRGTYLKIQGTRKWEYYETGIKDTALLLKAFVAHQDTNSEIGNLLRWILASRDVQGAWGSTHNTFTVIDAMIDYLAWKHETESEFELTATLDGVTVFGHTFSAKNIFTSFTHFIPIDSLTKNKMLSLVFDRKDTNGKENTLYYDMSLKYFVPVQSLPPRDEGITITRSLFALNDTENKKPIIETKVGDIVRGKITLITPNEYTHVAIEDMIPAGFEIVNFNLQTEDSSLQNNNINGFGAVPNLGNEGFFAQMHEKVTSFFGGTQVAQMYGAFDSIDYESIPQTYTLQPTHIESHDDRVFLYVDTLPAGVYEYEYYLRALVPGVFSHLPARAEELYFPEVFGRTSGDIVTVTRD